MRKNSILFVALLVSVTCLFAKTVTDYDHAVNFGSYHTYSWIGVTVNEPFWKDRVTNAIDNQLTAKGWQKVPTRGDASVSAFGSTVEQRRLETWYGGGFGGGWYHRGWWVGAGGPGYVAVESIPVGTLHVDIFDARTKKVIWHGDASDTLTQKPDKNEKKLEKEVAELFKKFPPPAKK